MEKILSEHFWSCDNSSENKEFFFGSLSNIIWFKLRGQFTMTTPKFEPKLTPPPPLSLKITVYLHIYQSTQKGTLFSTSWVTSFMNVSKILKCHLFKVHNIHVETLALFFTAHCSVCEQIKFCRIEIWYEAELVMTLSTWLLKWSVSKNDY